MKLLGAIEAGGTKFVCGIGYEDGTILTELAFRQQHRKKRWDS